MTRLWEDGLLFLVSWPRQSYSAFDTHSLFRTFRRPGEFFRGGECIYTMEYYVMPLPVADGRCWVGYATKGKFRFRAAMWPSPRDKRYYHHAVIVEGDRSYICSKRAIIALHAIDAMTSCLFRQHAPRIEKFNWKEISFQAIPFDTSDMTYQEILESECVS